MDWAPSTLHINGWNFPIDFLLVSLHQSWIVWLRQLISQLHITRIINVNYYGHKTPSLLGLVIFQPELFRWYVLLLDRYNHLDQLSYQLYYCLFGISKIYIIVAGNFNLIMPFHHQIGSITLLFNFKPEFNLLIK